MTKSFLEAAKGYRPVETNRISATVEDLGGIFSPAGEHEDQLIQIDGDTLASSDGQTRYRLAGAYAPEHGQVKDTARGPEFTQGEFGGPAVTAAMNQFLTTGGFNRVVKTGETDQYGREIVRMTNEKGEDATTEAYRAGILKPNKFATQEQVDAWEQGLAARELGRAQPYSEIVDQLDAQLQSAIVPDNELGLPEFGELSIDEREHAAMQNMGLYGASTGVQFDDPDRDLNNMAENSLGTAAYTGWLGLVDGAYGAMEMFGLDTGTEGRARIEQKQADLGMVENMDIREVDGIGDFFQYIGNNAVMSAPYLGLIAGSALLAPAGLVGAAISTVPVGMVYAGQTWNEMEGEKSAGAALAAGFAAAMVDRLGLAGIVPAKSFLTSSGAKAVAASLAAARGISLEAAEQIVKKEGKTVAVDMLRHMKDVGEEQLASYVRRGNLMKEVAGGALKGGVTEGITEGVQETLQYAGSVIGSDKVFNQYELEDRLINALAAGTALGAGFGSAGEVINYAGRDAEIRNLQKAQIESLNEIEQVRENLRASGEVIENTQEIRDRIRRDSAEWQAEQEALAELDAEARESGKKTKKKSRRGSFSDRASSHANNRKGFLNTVKEIESIPDAIATGIAGVAKLYQAAATTAFNAQDLANQNYGHILRDIRALVGQTRGVINPGESFEAAHDRTYSTIAQMVYVPEVMAMFKMRNQQISDKNRRKISKMLTEYGKGGYYDAIKEGRTEVLQDMPAHLKEHADALFKTAQRFEQMADRIHEVQNVANRKDGGEGVAYTKGWWWKHRGFDPAKVKKNKPAWYEFMRKHTNLSEQELNDMYDRIAGGDLDTIQDYFSHVRGIEYQPGQHKRREARLSEQEGFDMFGQDDMFTAMDNAAKSAARYSTNRDYFGAGGKNLDYLFDQLEAAGMAKDKVDEIAWYTKAIVDAQSGNFNRIQNYRWAAVQKFASTWAIIAGLPLAALSSLPEFAMIQMGLDKKEFAGAISNVGQQIAETFGEAAVGSFRDAYEAGVDRAVDGTGRPIPAAQARLNEAGLLWTPSAAAKRIGVGETNITAAWVQDQFFRLTGLTSVTQAQRRAAGAITSDFVGNRLGELAAAGDLTNLTTRQQHLYNQLAELGMDVDMMVELWKDFGNNQGLLDYANDVRDVPQDIMEIVDAQMKLAVYNFVNQRVQNPGAANRPLFFQDPHWQLLTQFNGFISTFTANVVPKLWNDYIKRGPPQVKYQTFALILGMMAMGAGSQYMKDWIKYGKVSPYLSNPQQLQRAIYASGVLGQGERLVDIAFPLYGSRPRSSFDWILDTMVGEAGPTVRNVGAIFDITSKAASGEFSEAGQAAGKVTPFIGPLGRFRKGLVGMLFGEGEEQFNYYKDL